MNRLAVIKNQKQMAAFAEGNSKETEREQWQI